MQGDGFRHANAVVRAAKVKGSSGSTVEDSWDDESVVRWQVDVEVRPIEGVPFAACCEVRLLGAYAVAVGEPVTIAYRPVSQGRPHIVEVEGQRREAVNQWLAERGQRATGAVREVISTDERGPNGMRFQLVRAGDPALGEARPLRT